MPELSDKKFDVVVIGELNIDLILNQIDSFPEIGKEKLAGQMNTTLGSSSAIFASNLCNLGCRVAFIGKVGNDHSGGFVIDHLQVSGVDTERIIKSDQHATGATVVLNFDEDRAMVTYPGAMEHLTVEEISDADLSVARHLHFSSYFLQPGMKADLAKLFQRARELGLTTSLDPQWDPREKWDFDFRGVLPCTDVFLPNQNELLHLTAAENIDKAIEKIKDLANCIVVKQGNQGSSLFHRDKTFHREPYLNESVIDAIGAGDSFNAGFIYKYVQKKPLHECQEFGNLAGAVSTTQSGGTAAFKEFKKIADTKFGYTEVE